jgi:hypothetical protein
MKITWKPDADISLQNKLFWYLVKPALWYIDLCSKLSGNGEQYIINLRIGDEAQSTDV